MFQSNFFRRTIFSRRPENENMVFHAVHEEILNLNTLITPFFTNYYFPGQHLVLKFIFEHFEVKITNIILFCIHFKDTLLSAKDYSFMPRQQVYSELDEIMISENSFE